MPIDGLTLGSADARIRRTAFEASGSGPDPGGASDHTSAVGGEPDAAVERARTRWSVALVLLSYAYAVGPGLVDSLTSRKYHTDIGQAAPPRSGLTSLVDKASLTLLLALCALIVLLRVGTMPKQHRLRLAVVLAPWIYMVVRDQYLRVPTHKYELVYPFVVVAIWALAPRLTLLKWVGYLVGATALVSIGMGVFLPSRGIYQTVTGANLTLDKALFPSGLLVGPLPNGNNLGQVLAIGLGAVLAIPHRTGRWVLAAATVVAAAWAGSRSCLGAIAVVLVLAGLLRVVRRPTRPLLVAGSTIPLAALIVILPIVTTDPTAFTNRGSIWTLLKRQWDANRSFGLGSNFFDRIASTSANLGGSVYHGHNQLMQDLVTGGYVLAFLIAAVIALEVGCAMRLARIGFVAPVLVLVGFLGASLLEVSYALVDRFFLLPVMLVPFACFLFTADHEAPAPAAGADSGVIDAARNAVRTRSVRSASPDHPAALRAGTGEDHVTTDYEGLMDASRVLRAILKHWVVFAVAVVVGVGLGATVVLTATPRYASSVTFFVSTPSTSENSALAADQFATSRVNSYVKLATSDRLARRLLPRVSPPLSETAVLKELSATADLNTVLLTVKVVDPVRTRSLGLAKAVAKQFPAMIRNIDDVGSGGNRVRLTVVSGPSTSDTLVRPSRVLNLGLGLLGGLLLGTALAVGRQSLDRTIRTAEDLRAVTDRPVLGEIPFDPVAESEPLVIGAQGRAPRAEALRQLRTGLQFMDVDRPVQVLVVTSSVAGEGKSLTAANLAIVFAETGRSTLLLEADMRRPKVTDYLGLERAVGLSNVLAGQVDVDDVLQPWGDADLSVLASGSLPPNPSEMMGSQAMGELVSRLRNRFDLVIIDTPPVLPVTDAVIAGTHADGVVMVVRHSRTTRVQVGHSAESLAAVDTRVLGTVLNMVRGRESRQAYEHYGYDQESSANMSRADAEARIRVKERPAAGGGTASAAAAPQANGKRTSNGKPGRSQARPAGTKPRGSSRRTTR